MCTKCPFLCTLLALVCVAASLGLAAGADLTANLKPGAPDLKSAGPLAFAPEGILLVGDPMGAAIFAIDTGDRKRGSGSDGLNVEGLDAKIAGLLGTTSQELLINDMAVNPISGKVYFSVSRGRGTGATPVLLRVAGGGKIEEVGLQNVRFAKTVLSNAPEGERQRMESITDLAFVDGRILVAGLSSEEFASRLRSVPFPFTGNEQASSVEIYHGSHGQFETRSPVRTFAPYMIEKEPHILAAYTCTPLVKIPVSQLKPGAHVKGTTVAELGNRNRPLDMVVYMKTGHNYILMANSSRGMMKITTDNIDKIDGITSRVEGTAGLTYETLGDLKGVQQLDRLNEENAVILVRAESGALSLRTIALP